jgi:hypothetical protein
MSIEFKKNQAVFHDVVSVEETECLLEWLQKKSVAKVDLSECSHLHPANLQVLLAAKAKIVAWPKNAELRAWLETVFKHE